MQKQLQALDSNIMMQRVIGKTMEKRGKFGVVLKEEPCKFKTWVMLISVLLWASKIFSSILDIGIIYII